MRLWKTGHIIADTVADAFIDAHPAFDCDLAYGILRGTAEIFKNSDSWFMVDKGFWNAGHFDGNYRISYKGTQPQYSPLAPHKDHNLTLEPWIDHGGYVLVCPPTEAVAEFFGVDIEAWIKENTPLLPHKVRYKTESEPINWDSVMGVITFNSSVGWQALQRGIPCISDTEHSLVGSYYKYHCNKKHVDYNFNSVMHIHREQLFRCMSAHQFTLAEIREGRANELFEHYLNEQKY